jgi:hypothetical protein
MVWCVCVPRECPRGGANELAVSCTHHCCRAQTSALVRMTAASASICASVLGGFVCPPPLPPVHIGTTVPVARRASSWQQKGCVVPVAPACCAVGARGCS